MHIACTYPAHHVHAGGDQVASRANTALGVGGPVALMSDLTGILPALGETPQAELNTAVVELRATLGVELHDWNGRGVWQNVSRQFGISVSRSSGLN